MTFGHLLSITCLSSHLWKESIWRSSLFVTVHNSKLYRKLDAQMHLKVRIFNGRDIFLDLNIELYVAKLGMVKHVLLYICTYPTY